MVDNEYEYQEEAGVTFQEYEEDFEAAAPQEVKVKVSMGLDTGLMFASFLIACGAIFVCSYLMWDVYNVRFTIGGEQGDASSVSESPGLYPTKEQPVSPYSCDVLGFGRDESVSNVFNYAILSTGTDFGVFPGLQFEIRNPANGTEVWVKLVVTDEIGAQWAKAVIVSIEPPLPSTAGYGAAPVPSAEPIAADPGEGGEGGEGGEAAPAPVPTSQGSQPSSDMPHATVWGHVAQIQAASLDAIAEGQVGDAAPLYWQNLTQAAQRLPQLLFRPGAPTPELKAHLSGWGAQTYIKMVEEKYDLMQRHLPEN